MDWPSATAQKPHVAYQFPACLRYVIYMIDNVEVWTSSQFLQKQGIS